MKKTEETNDDKVLKSTHHTLFKKKINGIDKPVKGKDNQYTKTKSYTKYRLFVDDFMEYGRELHNIYNELWDADENDTLELRINSNGGMVNEGSQFYSIIKNKFNGRTTTILDNKGYSMGALTFLFGNERIVTERADLMLHTYSTGMGGKSGEVEARNEHTQKHLDKFFREIIVDGGFLTKKEYKKMKIGQDYWFGVEELCKKGMATHVLKDGKKITANKYLKLIKSRKQD